MYTYYTEAPFFNTGADLVSYNLYIFLCCSMSGHRVVPSSITHFYSATKYAVTAMTEGLRQELREANTHIRATVRLYI